MNGWYQREYSNQSRPTHHPICQQPVSSYDPQKAEPWGVEVTAHVRRVIQQQCVMPPTI